MADQKGIQVYVTNGLNGSAIQGMLYVSSIGRTVVAIAENMELEKKAFTLGHELAHFMLGHLHGDAILERFLDDSGKQDSKEEEEADRFAEILLAQVGEEERNA